jgi:hypothetical protein
MVTDSRAHIVRLLFAEIGPKHHQAFIEVDGNDPEWPLWYAQELKQPLSEALGIELTAAELVHLLLSCEDIRQQRAPDAAWPDYYASYFLAIYPGN